MLKKLILILTFCIGTGVFAEDWDGSTSKPLSAMGTTAITMQTPGGYIVRVNGMSEAVNLK